MKGKFRSMWRVGIALVLVLSLSLVMAAPVPAASPADTDVGFEFGIAAEGDAVVWDAVPAMGLPAAGLGNYSVKLSKNGTNGPTTYVEFIPVAGTTLSELEALTNDWSFWYHLQTEGVSPAGPQLELKFTSGTDFVDITIMAAQATYATEDTWEEVVLADDLISVGYFGSVVEFDAGAGQTLADAIDKVLTEDPDSADWELTRVRVELYEAEPARDCYIDDVTIDGVTYELEPIFLDAEYYSVGDTVTVTVPNFNVNDDPIRIDPVGAADLNYQVTVISDSDTGITVDLEETGANTGVFTGSFTTVGTLPAGEDELYVQDGDDIIVTYDAAWGEGIGAQSTPLTASVDDTAPTIVPVSPTDDEDTEIVDGATTDNRTPDISASYTDDTADIDVDSVEMFLNGEEVDADADGSGVTYTPEEELVDGSYEVRVNVEDNAGNEATKTWSFRIVSWLEGPESGTGDLDALDTVGVAVSGAGNGSITVGRYASNPEPDAPPTFTMIENGFFDVKVTGDVTGTQIVIKFADDNITADSVAYFWGDVEQEWIACSDQGTTADYLWVKVRTNTTPSIAELGGTPFAISGEEVPPEFDVYELYDADEDGVISKTEALTAVADYFDDVITKEQALLVIVEYMG